VIIINTRQAHFIKHALAREREADRRAHAQQLEEHRALSKDLLKLCDAQKQLITMMAAREAAGARNAARPAPAPGSLREYAYLRYSRLTPLLGDAVDMLS
jgi:hypothetical protein